MRKTTEILRLKHEVGLTHRQIARSCGLTHPTVSKYLERAQRAGLVWPLPEDVDEEQLQALLFPETDDGQRSSRPLPDMEHIHKELRRAHMTLQLLWEEYRDDHSQRLQLHPVLRALQALESPPGSDPAAASRGRRENLPGLGGQNDDLDGSDYG